MRHMYDRDGNIAYAGKPRASRPWKSSKYRYTRSRTIATASEPTKAREVIEVELTHKERIAAILATSKYQHNFNN